MNLYHIAKILNFYLVLEPVYIVEMFFKLNLFDSLSKQIHNPAICDILISLILPSTSKYKLSDRDQHQLWRFCYIKSFFSNLGTLMLKGAEIPSSGERMLRETELLNELKNDYNDISREKNQIVKKQTHINLNEIFGNEDNYILVLKHMN